MHQRRGVLSDNIFVSGYCSRKWYWLGGGRRDATSCSQSWRATRVCDMTCPRSTAKLSFPSLALVGNNYWASGVSKWTHKTWMSHTYIYLTMITWMAHFLVRSCILALLSYLIFYTLVSVCLFSLLFFINLLSCQPGEFVQQSRACLVGDRFLYSPDPNHRASHRGLHD